MESIFNRLVAGNTLKVLNLLLTIVISFIMMPFVINAIGDKWYGLWVLVGTLMGYYATIDFGLLSATQRYLSHAIGDSKQLNKTINTAIVVLMLLAFCTGILTCIFYFIAPFLIHETEATPVLEVLILILGLKTAITLPFMVFNSMLSAKLRFDISSYVEIFKLLLRTLLIVVYLNNNYGVIALAWITFICELLGFVVIAFCAVKLYPEVNFKVRYFNISFAKEMFNYGKYTFISEVSDLLKYKVDDFIIAKYLSLASVTTYAIAYSLFYYAEQFVDNVFNGVLTVFSINSKQNKTLLKRNFIVFTEISVVMVTFLSVFILLFGDVFIFLWVGGKYSESYYILCIFIAIFITKGSHRSCVPLFYATVKHKRLAWWNIVEGISNVIFSLILMQYFGLLGVVLGTFIPCLFISFLLPHYACRIVTLNLNYYWRIILFNWFIGGLLGLCFFFILEQINITSYTEFIVVICPMVMIYIAFTLKYTLSQNLKEIIINNASPKIPAFLVNFFLKKY